MTTPKRNTIARKIRKQPDIQRKFKAYRKIIKSSRSGGRYLDAIWERDDLSTSERVILQLIAAQHRNQTKLFTTAVPIALGTLRRRSNLSLSGTRKLIGQLTEKGLLIVTRQYSASGADAESLYQLTPKLFKDFIQSKLRRRLDRIHRMSPQTIFKQLAGEGRQLILVHSKDALSSTGEGTHTESVPSSVCGGGHPHD
jgi:hypothetical protein